MKKQKIENYLIYLVLIIETLFLLFQTFYQSLQNDENEHLYDAYVVFNGYVPFLDFFEHHNPLMWYITAPLYFICENNANTYYIFRILMLVCVLITGLFTFKIAKKLSLSQNYSLLAVCFYLGFDTLKQTGIQIRPDPPMALFIIMGTYYLISYFTEKNIKNLILSILSFATSFWLLQKSVAFILPIALFLLILISLQKIKLSDVLSASFLPILLSFAYIFYLYQKDCLNLYYIYNYLGNIENTRTYGFFKQNSFNFTYKNTTILFCLLITIITFIKNLKQNKTLSLLAFYTICSFLFIVHVIYCADKHYMLPFLPLFSIFFSFLLKDLSKINLFSIFLFIFILCQLYFNYTLVKNCNTPLSYHIQINKFITNNTSPDDEVLIDISTTGIKKQAEGYYYFGQQDIVNTTHSLIPYKKLPNKLEIIQTKKPKIIYDNITLDPSIKNFLSENYTSLYLNTVRPIYVKK